MGQPPLTKSAQTDGEGVNSGHKQLKLHRLLLNFINFIDSLEDALDYPKRGHKKRKKRRRRPQRGARNSGSVAHTDAGSSESSIHTLAGERCSWAALGQFHPFKFSATWTERCGLMATFNIN